MKSLKGGAIYLAIGIALAVSLITSSLLLFAYFNKTENIFLDRQERVLNDFHSGMAVALHLPQDDGREDFFAYDLPGAGDSIVLYDFPWGVFSVVGAKSVAQGVFIQEIGMAGGVLEGSHACALYLQDHNSPLQISGSTFLKGMCYLPKVGVEQIRIEGHHAENAGPPDDQKQVSSNALPKVKPYIVKHLQGLLKQPPDSAPLPDTLISSFLKQEHVVFLSGESPSLRYKVYKGRVIIAARDKISIKASNKLEDVIIVAPKVIIEKGFEGSIQVIASDSLVVEAGVKLMYPSAVALVPASEKKSMLIGKGAHIEGVVLLCGPENISSSISIQPGASIEGLVYCSGFLEVKGMVHGTVYTSKFWWSTPSGIYENMLVDATIDHSKMGKGFCGTGILEGESSKKIMKWLY